jgi:sugar lactone lactonase YvrE
MAFDPAGNLFVAETGWDRVLRIDAGADGAVTGAPDELVSVVAGVVGGGFDGDGGPAIAARFSNPEDIAFDPDGNVLIVDRVNNRVRRVAAGADGEITGANDEIVSTVAGGGAATGDGALAVNAALNLPRGIAVDLTGNVFISEANALRVRRVDASTGVITTAAGGGIDLGEDIPAATAQLFTSRGIATDREGNLFIALVRGKVRAVRLAPIGAPDTTPPALHVPADLVTNATEPGGAAVVYDATAEDAECGIASFSCTPASGNLFPVGTTRVSCSATDLPGNESTAEFSVTVRGAAEQIADLMERLRSMQLSPPIKATLTVVLRVALAHSGNARVACEILRIFIAVVELASPRHIPADEATQLIGDAARIRSVLGC